MKIFKKIFITLCYLLIPPIVLKVSYILARYEDYNSYSISNELFVDYFLLGFIYPIIILVIITDICINKYVKDSSHSFYILKIFFACLYCIPLSYFYYILSNAEWY